VLVDQLRGGEVLAESAKLLADRTGRLHLV
jgi:hypothetical protein